MMEAALAGVILFALIGAITDFGLALKQYNYLSYSANRAAREIGTKLAVSGNCSLIKTELEKADPFQKHVQWDWCVLAIGTDWDHSKSCPTMPTNAMPSLSLSGAADVSCFFICRYLPAGMKVRATVTAAIDNPNIRCPGGKTVSP